MYRSAALQTWQLRHWQLNMVWDSMRVVSRPIRSPKPERYDAIGTSRKVFDSDVRVGIQALIANFATVYLVEGFAALSFAILLRNIDTNKLNRAMSIALCGFITAWMLAGVIAFAVTGAFAIEMSNVRLCFLRR